VVGSAYSCKSLQLLYVIFSFIFVWFEYTWGGLFHVMSRVEQAFVNLHNHLIGRHCICETPCLHDTTIWWENFCFVLFHHTPQDVPVYWPGWIVTPGNAIWPEYDPTQIETSPLLADIFLLNCRIITCLNLRG
jgi:hypothetical protein